LAGWVGVAITALVMAAAVAVERKSARVVCDVSVASNCDVDRIELFEGQVGGENAKAGSDTAAVAATVVIVVLMSFIGIGAMAMREGEEKQQ